MELIIGAIGLILVIFILGMLFRSKGDGVMDTMVAGCKSSFVLILLAGLAIAAFVVYAQ
jgi:hypothetical protein